MSQESSDKRNNDNGDGMPDADELHTATPRAKSSPIFATRPTKKYSIPPEEYCVMEETSASDANEASNESIQLDEAMDASSASSSSSSESVSYLLAMAEEMIARYPTADQIAGVIADNYINYITELNHRAPPPSPSLPPTPPPSAMRANRGASGRGRANVDSASASRGTADKKNRNTKR